MNTRDTYQPSYLTPQSACVKKTLTSRLPQITHTQWTDMAPTGSSIFSLSNIRIEKTTSTPAIVPIVAAPITETTSAPAVIPTSPARIPFNAIGAPRLFMTTWVVLIEASAPEHAEIAVVTKTYETDRKSVV